MSRKQKALPHLGELELAVLEFLWTVDESDVIATHEAVGAPRGITVNTVGSALQRLQRKGLVDRKKCGHAYRYHALLDREAFAARKILDAAGDSNKLADAGLLAAFVDLVADQDDSSLDKLAALIAEKRAKKEQP